MIPKIIHYCWFGGKELPELSKKCLESWQKYCPDFEIKRWDESNTDLHENAYIEEAYNEKKWAFVTDYIRLKILYENGGIYVDTDLEILKPIDCFLQNRGFTGFESDDSLLTGMLGSEKELPVYKELLSYYDNRHFIRDDGTYDITTNVTTVTNFFLQNGLILNNKKQTIKDICIYPNDYFSPKDYNTGRLVLTDNSYTIHHFDGSWLTEEDKMAENLRKKLIRFLPVDFSYKLAYVIVSLKNKDLKSLFRKIKK